MATRLNRRTAARCMLHAARCTTAWLLASHLEARPSTSVQMDCWATMHLSPSSFLSSPSLALQVSYKVMRDETQAEEITLTQVSNCFFVFVINSTSSATSNLLQLAFWSLGHAGTMSR